MQKLAFQDFEWWNREDKILPLDLVVTSVFFRSARKPVINWVIASISRGWKSSFWLVVSNIFYFHPYLGKIPILTHIFQMG